MAIGFMSFGGMLTGGDEENPALDSDPTNVGLKTEKVQKENSEEIKETAATFTVSDVSTLTKE